MSSHHLTKKSKTRSQKKMMTFMANQIARIVPKIVTKIQESNTPNSSFDSKTDVRKPVIGKVAYRLDLPQELNNVHPTFHVSNLKKCLAEEGLQVPLEELQINDTLQFVEKPVEIMDRGVKKLRRSRIPIVKVRWEGKRGAEFTWELESDMKTKYPHLFVASS
ncbi:hypothetical protein E3N88_12084 [Mikania micrantha]|uniref:Tf2-1-like SH3-like domain-containing protein n=1 Tax=Mikania micrantha TaxID=192012 RepID=A0A5N6P7H0_9ASTR|nr:hypothetical protein E3N88_12084 [Mikania micrantha]